MKYTFYIKLALLIIPVLILILIPIMDQNSSSIGGGNYDISELYFGILILLAIAVWFFMIMINSAYFFYRKNKHGLKENNPLLVIGIASFLIFMILFMFTRFN